ncbi:hypothetical protein DFH07DRAFT_786074 [Mycena maculata]|uniref:Uncharacterized protein n=1 Tax=Mycena maculata TaxID=230809 RepID=A0AAD7KJY3_9AGAR|nr:hypothetical protein DFH07DRAFT_786074 [Mycena maculata]
MNMTSKTSFAQHPPPILSDGNLKNGQMDAIRRSWLERDPLETGTELIIHRILIASLRAWLGQVMMPALGSISSQTGVGQHTMERQVCGSSSGPAPPCDPEKTKNRATLPSAFRSLRRSLTAVRNPWRRDYNPGSDDEEPVMVSRPSTPESRPVQSIDPPIHARDATIPTSSTPPPPECVQEVSTVSKPSKNKGNARLT